MNDEYARYLASYLDENSGRFIDVRAGDAYINYTILLRVIKEFDETHL